MRLHTLLQWLTALRIKPCLLYTSDAADDMQCVDLGGRRIIKKHRGGGDLVQEVGE